MAPTAVLLTVAAVAAVAAAAATAATAAVVERGPLTMRCGPTCRT